VASLLLACFFAAPFGAPLSDHFGRKPMIITAFFITSVGAAIQGAAVDLPMMLSGRCVAGVGIGLLSCIIPVYLAEITPQSIRGSVGSFFYLTLAIGILMSFLLTLAFNTYSLAPNGTYAPDNWRYLLGIQGILALVLIIFMLPLEDSPRWLVSVGKVDEARRVLEKTRPIAPVGRRRDENGEWQPITNVDLELDEIVLEVIENSSIETSWYDIHISHVFHLYLHVSYTYAYRMYICNIVHLHISYI
jgi:MFS family permease